MPAAVVGDDAVAVVSEEEHLILPIVAVQGPAVAEDHGGIRLVAPILVVDLHTIAEVEDGHRDKGRFEKEFC